MLGRVQNQYGSALAYKKKLNYLQLENLSNKLYRKSQMWQSSYTRAIVIPEAARNSKIPSIFPQPTYSIHKHITIPISTSVNGKAVIAWNPYYLHDTSASYSTFYVNNSSNLNLTSIEAITGYKAVGINYGIPANIVSSYRLVSASIQIVPQMSVTNAQGTIAGGICTYIGQDTRGNLDNTTSYLFAGDLTVASNVDNLLYFHKASVTELQSLRHIYFPLDPSYETYVPINYTHGVLGETSTTSSGSDFYFAYYITGTQASASFNVELYINFECLPTALAQSYIPISTYSGTEDQTKVIKSLSNDEKLVAQAASNIDEIINQFDDNESHESSFLNRSAKFIGKHLPDIVDIAKTMVKL